MSSCRRPPVPTHTDPSLSEASIRTAERGITILKILMASELAQKNCRAICHFHLFWHSLLVLSRSLYSSDTKRRQHDDTPAYTHYSIDVGEIITCHPNRDDSVEGSFVSTCEIIALLPFHEASFGNYNIDTLWHGSATLGLPWIN